jgi:hypothetical protein
LSAYQCEVAVSLYICSQRALLMWNISRSCRNKTDNFCYICVELTTAQRKPPSPLVRKGYVLCFGCKVGDHYKVWATKICCSSCSRTFDRLVERHEQVNTCAVPLVWREPRSHLDDWCSGITNTNGFSGKSEQKIEYPNIPSALRPDPRDDSMPVPEPPKNYTLDSETESEEGSPEAGPSTRKDQDFSAYSSTGPLDH